MKFKYRQVVVDSSEAFPKRKYILRPIIPVSLIYNDRRLRFEALIDSGADYTIFPGGLGRMLGLNVESGKKDSIVGVSGDTITIYFHKITIEVGGLPFKIFAGFADGMNQSHGILGQSGFFDNLKVEFDLTEKEVKLSPKAND